MAILFAERSARVDVHQIIEDQQISREVVPDWPVVMAALIVLAVLVAFHYGRYHQRQIDQAQVPKSTKRAYHKVAYTIGEEPKP